MKFRILVLALATALLGASAALAHDGQPGKGKRPPTGPNCKTSKVLLKGTLANDPVAGDTSFQLTATKGNHKGRAYVSATQPVTFTVDVKTKVMRKAKDAPKTNTLESLAMGDRALVLGSACKGDFANGATPALTAKFVLARPASA
jgi:hypothetical protein